MFFHRETSIFANLNEPFLAIKKEREINKKRVNFLNKLILKKRERERKWVLHNLIEIAVP